MATFNVPDATPRSVYQVERFHGVDFTSSPEIVSSDKSPNAYNMVRDAIGTVRKSMGYYKIAQFDDPVYGFYKLRADNKGLYHSGSNVYRDGKIIYKGIAENPATAFELNGKLWIADGKELLLYTYYEKEFEEALSLYNFKDKNIYYGMKVEVEESFEIHAGNNSYKLPRSGFEVTEVKDLEGNEVSGYSRIGINLIFEDFVNEQLVVKTKGEGYIPHDGTYVGVTSANGVEYLDNYKINIKVFELAPASKNAYIPMLRIGQPPNGGSDIGIYESINLLQDKVSEKFYGDGKSKEVQLMYAESLDEDFIIVEKMEKDTLEWKELKRGSQAEGADYEFDTSRGVVTFYQVLESVGFDAQGLPVGEDNYCITYKRTGREEYHDRINKCTIGALYGVSGASDRLFLSGNSELINYDWFSGFRGTGSSEGKNVGGAYFPDINYGVVGNESSKIVGYTIVNNYLATHKDELSDERTVIIRSGSLTTDELGNTYASFPIVNTLQGPGAISPRSFAYLQTEPMFLTSNGIYAITASDVTGEKYSQRRSYFLNGRLTREPNLGKSFAVMFNDYYMLFINGGIYMLDGLQTMQSNSYDPYSTRQYAGFYRNNVDALCAWNDDRTLNFGTSDGSVYRFFTDPDDPASYMDKVDNITENKSEGEPVDAMWETSEISGERFYKNKTFRHLALKLKSSPSTSVKAYGYRKGLWKSIKDEDKKTRYFDYKDFNFEGFSYSTDDTSRTIPTKIRLRRLDKAKFRLVNSEKYQPFGIVSYAVEYVSGNNYKG